MRNWFDIGKVIFYVGIYLMLLQGNTVFAANDYSSQINQMNLILDAIDEGKDVSEEDLTILENGMKTVMGITEDKLTDETRILKQRYELNDEAQIKIIEKQIIQVEKDKQALDKAADENEGQVKYLLKKEAASKNTEIAILKHEIKLIKNYCFAKNTKCTPYCKYKGQIQGTCTLCGLFARVYNTVNQLGTMAVVNFSSAVAQVVVVGFGIWLAVQILAFVSSIETRDLKDLMSSILTQGFIVMLVFIILQSGVANFFNTFVSPVYLTGQKLAQEMFSDNITSSSEKALGFSGMEDARVMEMDMAKSSTITLNRGAFDTSMGESIIKTMTMMENRVRKFKALGSSLMCQSWVEAVVFFPRMIYLITGLLLWILSMVLIIGVPFLMVDAVFQLGVAWALKKVWETFLNSMFSFVFISIVVLLLLFVLQEVVTESVNTIQTQSVSPTGQTVQLSFDDMFTASADAKTYFEALMTSFHWGSWTFLKVIFVFILAWSVMNMAKELADDFASSISSTSIGSSIGAMAASTAKGMAVKAAKPLGRELWRGTKRAGAAVARAPFRAVGTAKRAIRNRWENRRFARAQADADGKKSFTTKKGVRYTMENGVVTKEKGGEKTIRYQGLEIVKTRQIKEINGRRQEVFNEQVKMSEKMMNRLVDKDGKINQKEMKQLLNGLNAEQKKEIQLAVNKAITDQRINSLAYTSKGPLGTKKRQYTQQQVVSFNEQTGESITRAELEGGVVAFTQTKLNADGTLTTSVTTIDSKGNVRAMSSDGIHNKLEEFRLKDGVNPMSVKDINNINEYREQDADGKFKGRTSYGYTKEYRDLLDRGRGGGDLPLGMFSEDEAETCYKFYHQAGNEFQKARMNTIFK